MHTGISVVVTTILAIILCTVKPRFTRSPDLLGLGTPLLTDPSHMSFTVYSEVLVFFPENIKE